MNQSEFLARVREAVKSTQSPNPDYSGDWRPLAGIANDGAALVERFIAEVDAVGGRAERVRADGVNARIAEIAREWNAKTCAVAGAVEIRGLGLGMVDAAQADLGLSDALCAIAETGTLVLTSGKRESRSATVLPPRHIAIVRAEQIVPNCIAALEVVREKFGNEFPSSITFVTGPSRTADIELSLTIGVHGPGEVVVLIVE